MPLRTSCPLHDWGKPVNLKTQNVHCGKSPLFFLHSTMTSYYSAAFISSSTLTIIVLQTFPILFPCAFDWSVIRADTPDISFATCSHIGMIFSMLCTLMRPSGGRLCGLICSPLCSLCNYQLDFISLKNNKSLPQCVVQDPDPAVCEQKHLGFTAAEWLSHCREK